MYITLKEPFSTDGSYEISQKLILNSVPFQNAYPALHYSTSADKICCS
jgi:hypothetical protein